MVPTEPLYTKGDLRRMLMVLGAIDAEPGITVARIAALTRLARKTVDVLIRQAVEQAAVVIEKRGSGFQIVEWGPVFKAEGARTVLMCALNAHTMPNKK